MTSRTENQAMTTTAYRLAAKPSTLTQTINRYAAATGSPRTAAASGGADFNGHRASTVEPNSFKRDWTATYRWAGIHRISRGSFEQVHLDLVSWYNRQGAGGSVSTTATTPEQGKFLEALGYVLETPEQLEAESAADGWKVTAWRSFCRGWGERFEPLETALISWDEVDEAGWLAMRETFLNPVR